MRKLCAVAFFLAVAFFYNTSIAQEVVYSPYEKFDFRGGGFTVVGKVGDRIYTYRGSAEGFFLDAFNDNMELQATVILDFFPKKVFGVKFVVYGDKMIAFYQSMDGNKVVQQAALLDDKGRLKKAPVTIDSEKGSFFSSARDYFTAAVSESKEYIVVYATDEHGQEVDLRATWLDDELNILSHSIAVFKTENDMATGEGMVSNNGAFYISAYTPLGNKGFADQVWMLSLAKGSNKFRIKELPLNNMYATGIYMKLDNAQNKIYAGGFYSDKKNGNYEGVLYATYDIANADFTTHKLIAFDERMRSATGERSQKKAFNDYQVRQLIVKNDGGFVLVAEEYYVTTRNSYAPGLGYYSWYYPTMSASVREYHYNDIMVISYAADGARDWTSFIRKDQYSQEDGGLFSSYTLVNTGGALGFLYNDYNSSHSRMQLASVDGDGKINTRAIAGGGAEDPDWLPRSGKQVSAREMVIPCLRKRQICFAKVVF